VRQTLVVIVASLTAAVSSLVGGGAPRAYGQSDGWFTRADLMLPRSETSTAVLDGRIYVMGGYPGGRITSDAVQVYDSRTDSWSLGPPLPRPLHHTMTAVVDGRLYLFGGEAGNPTGSESVFQSATFMLDETAGTWVERTAMPTARSGGGTGVIDGKVYVAGGRPPLGSDLAVYDPAADQWTVLPAIPTQRNHLGVGAIDGRLYVAGGRFGGGVGSEMTDILEIYDPRTNAWTSGAPLLAPRAGVAAAVLNGCLFLLGGEGNDADPRGVFEQNEVYDPGTNSWRSLAPIPLPVHGLTYAGVLDGSLYLASGATRRGVSGQDVSMKLQGFRTDMSCPPPPLPAKTRVDLRRSARHWPSPVALPR
jgi:N-acetylneuraminic acid mutarotase